MASPHPGSARIVPAKCILHGETPSSPEDHVCELPPDAQKPKLTSTDLQVMGASAVAGLLVALVWVLFLWRWKGAGLGLAAVPIAAYFILAAFVGGSLTLVLALVYGAVLIPSYALGVALGYVVLSRVAGRRQPVRNPVAKSE